MSKLDKVQEALEYTADCSPNFRIVAKVEEALAELKEFREWLDSEELVKEMERARQNYDSYSTIDCMKAAINVIKEETNE